MCLMSPFSLLIEMAQEKVPKYLGTVSSLMGGFVRGCGGALVVFFAKIAKIFGIEYLIGFLTILPLFNLVLLFADHSFRSQKT